jgi:hypothetical protein
LGWEDWYKDNEIPHEPGIIESILGIIFIPIAFVGMCIVGCIIFISCKLALSIIEIKEKIDKKNPKFDTPSQN